MPRDSQTKLSKKEMVRSKKQDELSKKKKKNSNSDDDNSIVESDSENEEMDVHEYRKFISKIFPSKHVDKKIKAGEKLKKVVQEESKKKSKKNNESDDEEEEIWETASDDSEYEEKVSKKNKKSNKKSNKKQKKIEVSDDDDDDDEYFESDDDEIEEKTNKNKLNIIFTIGGVDEDDDEEEWDDDSDYDSDYEEEDDITEDEDEEVSTDESDDEEEEEEEEVKPITRKKVTKKETSDINSAINSNKENIITILKGLQSKSTDTALIDECIKVCEEKIKFSRLKQEKKIKKEKARNERIFKRILRDKNTMNDFDFFEKLEQFQQKKIIKELKEINKITRVEKPYRLTLLEAEIPLIFKSAALKKISTLRHMEPGSGEFYKIKNWVDTFMRIPFGKYEHLPISIDNGVEACHEFMASAQKTLDEAVYGLNDAKMQIMQLLGQLVTNPKAIGTAIAIQGPAGTGKTTLVKEGISKILNRPFAFIALGGATDSSFLEGHGYTYEGSMWGKIVQILIDSKCMNPVIYFDELDKISDTPKGEEITGILTHLTDTSQNSQFHDKYFAEIDFDLSKCLFIFSYNDESKVNPILKDRMYRIQTKGYNQKQKTVIANNYLLPKIRDQVRFKVEDIVIPDETEHYIIDNFCNKEDGVRNLKRCLEIIYTKLNLYRLMRPGSNLFEEDMALKVEFPFKVTKDIVDKLIKTNKENTSALHSLYV